MSRANRKAYTDFSMELTKKTKTSHKNKILQKKIPYAAAEPMRAIITGTLYIAGILYKQLTKKAEFPREENLLLHIVIFNYQCFL